MAAFRSFGLALACSLVASLALAQGLGEAAAREKKRRDEEQKKRGSAKVVTTDDLPKGGSGSGEAAAPAPRPDPTPKPPSLSPGRRRRTPTSEERESGEFRPETAEPAAGQAASSQSAPRPGDEDLWRERAEAARQKVKDAEAHAQDLQQNVDQLLGRILQSTDTNELLRLRAEQQDVIASVEAAKAAAVAARQAIPVLEEEARRAGVPPGWLR